MDTLPQSYQSSCRTRSRAMIHVRPASQDVVGIPKCATTIPSPNIRLPQWQWTLCISLRWKCSKVTPWTVASALLTMQLAML